MILVIDNYDSFTYNLVQLLGELNQIMEVRRNDAVNLEEIEKLNPDRIVISPGPGVPRQAGVTLGCIQRFAGRKPLLGVCLGHQAIGEAFGGRVVPAPKIMHGKTSLIRHDGKTIFTDVPKNFEATRYHSLVVERETLPKCLEVSAQTDDGIIMGLRHKQLPVEGVQFHPESILTHAGKRILENFLRL